MMLFLKRVVKAFVGLGIFSLLGVFFLVACFNCFWISWIFYTPKHMITPNKIERIWFQSNFIEFSLWSLVNDSGSFGFVMSEKRRAHSCKISKKSEKLLAFLSDVKTAPLERPGRGCTLEERRLNGEAGGSAILEVVGHGESGQRESGRIKILSLDPVSVDTEPSLFWTDSCPRPLWKIKTKFDYDSILAWCESPQPLVFEPKNFSPSPNIYSYVQNFHLDISKSSNWYFEILGEFADTSFLIYSLPLNFRPPTYVRPVGQPQVLWLGVQEDATGELKQVDPAKVAIWNASWNQAFKQAKTDSGKEKGLSLGEIYFRGISRERTGSGADQIHLSFFEIGEGLSLVQEQRIEYDFLRSRTLQLFVPEAYQYVVKFSPYLRAIN